MVNSRKRTFGLLALIVGAGASLAAPGCSSSFSSCEELRDCPNPDAGGGSEGGAGGAPSGQAGDSGGEAGHAAAGESGADNSGAGAPGADAEAGASGTNVGAGGEAGASGGSGGGVPLDAVPPTIIGIIPANGATKLSPTTDKIVITFSEPMNQASAQSAYVPTGGGNSATFSWNAMGTVLTIDPKLPYPSATDPSAAAVPFKFSVTTAARDLAGNRLAAIVNWQFTLLREITQTFPLSSGGYWDAQHFSGLGISAGDDATGAAIRGFFTYDISALPAAIGTIESATIKTSIDAIIGDPFGSFGSMLIETSPYTAINQAAFDAPTIYELGTFIAATGTNAAGNLVSKDVLLSFKDQYVNRNGWDNLIQYKVLFASAPNSNDASDVVNLSNDPSSDRLVVKYLYP